MCAKLKGNWIPHLRFMAVFCKCAKRRRKKTKKMSDFLKAYISGTAGAMYFRFDLVWSRDHRTMNVHKIIPCSSC